jgi:predicted dehydrogenase
MVDAFRVGVVGTGFGERVQIPGFRKAGFDVVAVGSARKERAEAVAAKWDIPAAYDDYASMLDGGGLDVVSVVTPPHLHRAMSVAALQRRLHVLCEKPFAMDGAEAEAMVAAAEASGTVHAVDFEFRYLPVRQEAKRLLDAGYVGEVRGANVLWFGDFLSERTGRPFGWLSDREKGGGLLGAAGSHAIDLIRWLLGEPTEVASSVRTFVPRRTTPTGDARAVTADDAFVLRLRMASGAEVVMHFNAAVGVPTSRIELVGTDGTLVMERDTLLGAKAGEAMAPLPVPPPEEALDADDARLQPFVALARRFAANLRGEARELPTFEDGLRCQRIMDAARASSARGETVRLG